MSQPPAYTPQTEFLVYQAQQAWFPGQQLDVEFNSLQTSVKAIEANLVLIQEDDGSLGNGTVGFPQLDVALATALSAIGVAVPLSTVLTQSNTWTHLQSFAGSVAIGSAGVAGDLAFTYTGAPNTITIGGGVNVGALPHLLFQASTALPAPNTMLVGFGTDNTWAFSYNDYQAATVSIVDPYGTGAFAAAMRTSDRRTGSANPVMVAWTTVHDNPSAGSPASNVWGIFQIAWKTAAAQGSGAEFMAYEMSIANFGSSVVGDPFTLTSNESDATFGLRIDSGDGPVATGIYDPSLLNPVTNAIDIVSNGSTFNAGIRFGNGAIAQVSGHRAAIQFALGHEILWYSAHSTVAGEIVTDASGVMQLLAVGGTINIFPAAGFALLNWGNNGVNYIAANNGSSSFFQFQVNSVNVAALSATALAIAATTAASSSITGSLRTAGGLGVAGAAYIGGDTKLQSGTASTTTTTGALVVTGGVGVSGAAFVGGVIDGASTINAATAYKVAGTQVVAARATGWTVATGTPQRSTFTTSGVTLAQLAGVVMALEQDLIAHGLIGT